MMGRVFLAIPWGVAILASIAFVRPGYAQDVGQVYPLKKVVQYGYTLQNISSNLLKKAEFRTYAPVKQTATQKVLKLVVSHPYRLMEDEYGNQVLAFEFENMPPNSTKVISITAEMALANKPNSLAAPASAFLGSEPYIETNNEQVQTLAQSLISGSLFETANNIQRWIASNIQSEVYIPDDRGALYALKRRSGDCTEFSYLFAALGRANGIPTRIMGGYVYENNATLKATDYHNWAEFYTDGVWQLADPQKKNFAAKQSSYVAMRVISPGGKGILGGSHRFSYAGEGLRVTMQ